MVHKQVARQARTGQRCWQVLVPVPLYRLGALGRHRSLRYCELAIRWRSSCVQTHSANPLPVMCRQWTASTRDLARFASVGAGRSFRFRRLLPPALKRLVARTHRGDAQLPSERSSISLRAAPGKERRPGHAAPPCFFVDGLQWESYTKVTRSKRCYSRNR